MRKNNVVQNKNKGLIKIHRKLYSCFLFGKPEKNNMSISGNAEQTTFHAEMDVLDSKWWIVFVIINPTLRWIEDFYSFQFVQNL